MRYIRVTHHDFKGNTKTGETIIHNDATQSLVEVFKELYAINYPIKQMRLVSNFRGNDWQSIDADNTSAFNPNYAIAIDKSSKAS